MNKTLFLVAALAAAFAYACQGGRTADDTIDAIPADAVSGNVISMDEAESELMDFLDEMYPASKSGGVVRTIASRYAAGGFGETNQYKLEINAGVNPNN